MFGPEPADPRAARAGQVANGSGFGSGFSSDQGVQGQARAFVAEGLDFAAIALLDDHLETSPDFAWGWMFAAQLCLRAEQSDADRTELSQALLTKARANLARLDREDRLPPINTGSNYTNWFVAGWAAWAAGDEPRARETFLAGLAQNTRQTEPGSIGRLYDGACLLALAGETDAAIERIERLPDAGYNNPRWLARDPDLQPLHYDPRFFAVIERLETAQTQARRQAEQNLLGPDSDPTPEPESGPDSGPVSGSVAGSVSGSGAGSGETDP